MFYVLCTISHCFIISLEGNYLFMNSKVKTSGSIIIPPFVTLKAETFHAILESLCIVTVLNDLHAICSYFTFQLIWLNHRKILNKVD